MAIDQNRTLLVTGASGQLGRRILESLLESKPGRIVAVTRTPEKVADLEARGVVVRKGDYDDPAGLVEAFLGADRLLMISGSDIMTPGRRLKQHRNAVESAVKAGVKHVVYTSMPNPDAESPIPFAPDHRGTEEALAASPLTWTVLRNHWYMDNLPLTLTGAVASGKLLSAAGTGASAYVMRADCARAAAAALASTDTSKRVINITGPTAVTKAELARLATEVTGRTVTVVSMEPAELKATLVQAGVPDFLAGLMTASDLAIAKGKMGPATTAVADLTGKPPLGVAEFLASQREALIGAPAAATR
jgi:NAD(P)H dehydrogenase (quinone)